jgi:hypothetical protein
MGATELLRDGARERDTDHLLAHLGDVGGGPAVGDACALAACEGAVPTTIGTPFLDVVIAA